MAESISVEAQWVEDKASHRACCEMSLNGAIDPVIAIGASFPVLGVPVPPKLTKYIKAGIYINVDFSASVSAACALAYWPDAGETRWKSLKLEVKGSGSAELAAELARLQPRRRAGQGGRQDRAFHQGLGRERGRRASGLGQPRRVQAAHRRGRRQVLLDLIETEHSWQIFESIKTDEVKYVFGE